MAYRFKNESIVRSLVPLLPSNTAANYVPNGATDCGKLIVLSSNLGAVYASTSSPEVLLGTANSLFGILISCPENTTHGSSVPFYVAPLRVGDIIEADYSTTYSGSTNNLIGAATNLGSYFKPCHSTGSTSVGSQALNALYTQFINPSTLGTVPCSSECMIFKLIAWTSQDRCATFLVQTS